MGACDCFLNISQLSYRLKFRLFPAVIVCLLSIASASRPACAVSFDDAVSRALRTDPVFLAAQANLEVSHERSAQALSGMLPQITASASTTLNRRDYRLGGSNRAGVQEKYNSNTAQLNLTQPLWQRAKYFAVTQADFVVAQSTYQLEAAKQDLFVRLVQAWFDVMQARDAVTFSVAQSQAAEQQWEQAKRGKKLGLMSAPELEDADAKYEQAKADQAGMESEQAVKLAAFEQIVGEIAPSDTPFLRDEFSPPDMSAHTLEQWLSGANDHNPSVLAAKSALEAANEETRKQYAGHEPTLDIVASYGNAAQGAGISGGQVGFESRQNTLGLQMNLPLYSGGGQNAKVREAEALKAKAEYELEAAQRTARANVKQAWFGWKASLVRQQSATQAVKSTALAVKAAESEKNRGLKINLDILQEQQKEEGAKRDLQKARYDMITSYLKLKAATGELTEDDMRALGKEFRNTF